MANYPKCPKCGATGPVGADMPNCACIPEREVTDVSKLGTLRLKNEEALQFRGPRTNHCFGIPYVSFGIRGVRKEGDAVQSVDDIYEANRLFFSELNDYTKDAKQIAWRLYPEVTQTEDGMWTIRARLAVFK